MNQKAEISRRKRYFAVEQRRDFYVVDLSDDSICEKDFKTRADAKRWIHKYVTRDMQIPSEGNRTS
ncbi:MAG: hypothetical protein ACRD20_19490 [Terriglobales bacterium]